MASKHRKTNQKPSNYCHYNTKATIPNQIAGQFRQKQDELLTVYTLFVTNICIVKSCLIQVDKDLQVTFASVRSRGPGWLNELGRWIT